MVNKALERPPWLNMTVLRPSSIRASNLLTSYTLFQHRRRLSRAELARLTGLTRVTSSELVDTLQQARVVRSIGFGEPTNGRPPEFLEFDPSARLALGLELSPHQLRAVVADLDGQPLRVLVDDGSRSKTTALRRAVALMTRALAGLPDGSVIGMGAGVPGTVDPLTGSIESASNAGWRHVPVGKTLTEAFGFPVMVINHAKAAGLAECWSGVGRGCRHVVFISIGTGIASGIFLDGQLYRGTRSSDGALGHVNVLPDGPACICGRKGCLEAVAAVPALLRELERIEPHGRGSDWTLERAREVVEIGDPAAVEALRTVARYLGVVTANIVNLLNPQMIVLGGPLPRTLPMLVELVREEVQQRAMPAELLDLQVTASALKDEAVALGAATLVLSSAEHIEKMLRGVAVFTSTRRSDSQYANA